MTKFKIIDGNPSATSKAKELMEYHRYFMAQERQRRAARRAAQAAQTAKKAKAKPRPRASPKGMLDRISAALTHPTHGHIMRAACKKAGIQVEVYKADVKEIKK